jgi:hypothetical protein
MKLAEVFNKIFFKLFNKDKVLAHFLTEKFVSIFTAII